MDVIVKTIEDLHFVSALLQDAITSSSWIKKDNKKLFLMLNRICRENPDYLINNDRVNSLLCFENIEYCLVKNLKESKFKYLLAIVNTCDDCDTKVDTLLVFSDNSQIKLYMPVISVKLYDISEQWRAKSSDAVFSDLFLN